MLHIAVLIRVQLEQLEEAMWRPETRGDQRWMEAHLSASFNEFGQSGRRYTRAEILDADVGDFSAVLPLRDLTMRPLGEHHVLITYQSEMDGIRANRSSIWKRTESGWLMEFHQGTPRHGRRHLDIGVSAIIEPEHGSALDLTPVVEEVDQEEVAVAVLAEHE
ncbi:hypothetical protein BH24ACT5_BH24ACT5_12520 [soil metagenome]